MDVKFDFMHGSLKEEVYGEQSEGFKVEYHKTYVCRLNKSLYGLKQDPRALYERTDSYLMKLGFIRSEDDLNLYFKVGNGRLLILFLYADDIFFKAPNPLIYQCKRKLDFEFEMKDLGLMHYFLGLVF